MVNIDYLNLKVQMDLGSDVSNYWYQLHNNKSFMKGLKVGAELGSALFQLVSFILTFSVHPTDQERKNSGPEKDKTKLPFVQTFCI